MVSLILLVLFAPFLVGAAIAIKMDDGGPVLYSQERVTRNDKSFRIYKMRTMRTDAEKSRRRLGLRTRPAHHPRRQFPAPKAVSMKCPS